MEQSEKYYRRVYCPGHKLSFPAPVTSTILCASGGEALAQGFPNENFWCYCCDCMTFWPADFLTSDRGRAECSVCSRAIIRRYLCDQCKVMSTGGEHPQSSRLSALVAGGDASATCPGCLMVSNGARKSHQCPDAAMEFVSTLSSCPFCFEAIEKSEGEKLPVNTKQSLDGSIAANKGSDREVSLQLKPEGRRVYPQSPPFKAPERTPPTRVPPSTPLPPYIPGNGTQSRFNAQVLTTPAGPQPETKARRGRGLRVLIAGSIMAAFIVIYFVAVMWRLQTQTAVNKTAANREAQPRPQPPPMMAYVPGGEFQMGSNDGDEYERPQHRVTLKPFYIDVYEVTCEDYEKFVRATGHAPPRTWKNGQYSKATARWPVTGVTWDDAVAYAKWAGKRLPTEEEWEFAARGSDGRRYPWGNDWKSEAANADAGPKGHFTDVGSYPAGKSPFGLFDMSGNAWEWTSSALNAYPNGRLPQQTVGEEMKVIRSGFWGSPSNKATVTFRRGWPARGDYDYKNTGFRCARDGP